MSKLTLDEAIKHCEEVAEQKEHDSITTTGDYELDITMKEGCIQCAADHRQLAEWLTELKDLREENKVLASECDRLIKEKGELLSKVSGGDVLRICQLEEQFEKAKELLKSAIDEWQIVCKWGNCGEYCGWFENGKCTQEWSGKADALKLIES